MPDSGGLHLLGGPRHFLGCSSLNEPHLSYGRLMHTAVRHGGAKFAVQWRSQHRGGILPIDFLIDFLVDIVNIPSQVSNSTSWRTAHAAISGSVDSDDLQLRNESRQELTRITPTSVVCPTSRARFSYAWSFLYSRYCIPHVETS
jgi:hypothetical protein